MRVLCVYCRYHTYITGSVADTDPGSGIRCLFDPWIRDSGSRVGFFRIPDLGSRIPNPYFWQLSDNVLGKKFYNSLKIGPIFLLQHFKNKIVQFCEIYGPKKKGMKTNFFSLCLSLLFLDPESGIGDPGSGMGKNQDPGSGINIPDPQHWFLVVRFLKNIWRSGKEKCTYVK